MFTLALALLTAQMPTPAAAPTQPAMRRSVEKSLVFLRDEGVAWMETKKCASCHAVPMTLWSQNEAVRRNFAVDQPTLKDLTAQALKAYVEHPKFKPVGQDGTGDGLSRATIFLVLGAGAAPQRDPETSKSLDKLAGHLLATQRPDGSWTGNYGQPPVADTDDVTTMLAVLALSAWRSDGTDWAPARDRALAWLRQSKPNGNHQGLVLRVLVLSRFGQPGEADLFLRELLERQNGDGSWSQTKDLPGDALATGQTLYVLGLLGRRADDPAVQRAVGFLLRTQRKDGSWLVTTRVKNGHNVIISYTGTAWATMGMIQLTTESPSVPRSFRWFSPLSVRK
jgi:hypothetical protein